MGRSVGDSIITSTIIDILVHHSMFMNIKGKSYRIKDIISDNFNENKYN